MVDEKHIKGISLRRKKTTRPTISAPRQISAPRDPSADSRWDAQTTASGVSTSSREPRPGISRADTNTSDLVKRRYSTRFAVGAPVQDGLAPPTPNVPVLPTQYGRPSTSQARSPSHDGRPAESGPPGQSKLHVDARALKDPNLQAEKYVRSILGDASESDIRLYQDELQNLKLHTSTDLQHNVYQNRTQFIKISKEADKLKTEMRTLRVLMSELTGALGHATSAAGGSELSNGNMLSVADRKRANRSSVANLEAMWSTHLQTLWKRVEGSQKYLPALPGRHIVMESQRWVELNAATWKPKRRVALVLLNDHFLVATEKKRADVLATGQNSVSPARNNATNTHNMVGQSQTTLVADRCWALQDVGLADISSQASSNSNVGANNIANAISIRSGTESFTYATSDNAAKASLIVAFRKAQEDLRKQLAAEHGERERALDEFAVLSGRDSRSLKQAASSELLEGGGIGRSNSVLIDVDGRQQSLRWVESQIDGLDIDIALQRFEEAVARVEKLRKIAQSIKGNAFAQDIILAKVNERAAKVASSIARQLVQTSSGTDRTKENVAWLLRLGYEDMARTQYLQARTATIHLRTRQLPFTGALQPYLHALSYTTFTLILHTFRTFSGSFPAAAGSAVVKWAKERLDEFNDVLARHLSSVEINGEVWQECLQTAREQASVLSEVGVDFTGLVGKHLASSDGTANPQIAKQDIAAIELDVQWDKSFQSQCQRGHTLALPGHCALDSNHSTNTLPFDIQIPITFLIANSPSIRKKLVTRKTARTDGLQTQIRVDLLLALVNTTWSLFWGILKLYLDVRRATPRYRSNLCWSFFGATRSECCFVRSSLEAADSIRTLFF
nr:exocyst complex component exo84 [Quercus suber]